MYPKKTEPGKPSLSEGPKESAELLILFVAVLFVAVLFVAILFVAIFLIAFLRNGVVAHFCRSRSTQIHPKTRPKALSMQKIILN